MFGIMPAPSADSRWRNFLVRILEILEITLEILARLSIQLEYRAALSESRAKMLAVWPPIVNLIQPGGTFNVKFTRRNHISPLLFADAACNSYMRSSENQTTKPRLPGEIFAHCTNVCVTLNVTHAPVPDTLADAIGI